MDAFEALQPGDPRQMGPYRIVARLGAGGMGHVYLGQSRGGRAFAVKVVRPELAENNDFGRRFAREVASARRVNGVFTAGVVDADPEGSPAWLATAYVPGISLDEAISKLGPWPEEPTLALAAALAEALEAIHTAGVVHRDLKPSNVLLASDGPRVIDFGISLSHGALTAITGTGEAIGTPGFMSPEQLKGDPVGPASDVFSLGAVLALVASGTGPFGHGSLAEVTFRIVYQEPQLDGIAPRLRDVVARCLAKQPELRPTVGALLDELAASVTGGREDAAFTRAGWLPPAVARKVHARATEAQLPAEPAAESAPQPARNGVGDHPATGIGAHHPPTGVGDLNGSPAGHMATGRTDAPVGGLPGTGGVGVGAGGAGFGSSAVGTRVGDLPGASGADPSGALAGANAPGVPDLARDRQFAPSPQAFQPQPGADPATSAPSGPHAGVGFPSDAPPVGLQGQPHSPPADTYLGAPGPTGSPVSTGSPVASGPATSIASVGAPSAEPGGAAPQMAPFGHPPANGRRHGATAPMRQGRRRPPKRWPWMTAAVCAVLGTAITVWLVLPSSQREDHNADGAPSSSQGPDGSATDPSDGSTHAPLPPGAASARPSDPSSAGASAEPSTSADEDRDKGKNEDKDGDGKPDPPDPESSSTSSTTEDPNPTSPGKVNPPPRVGSSTFYVSHDSASYVIRGSITWRNPGLGASFTAHVVAPPDGCGIARFITTGADGTTDTQDAEACRETKDFSISEDNVANPTAVTVQLLVVRQDGTRPPVGDDQCAPTSSTCS